MSVVALPTKVSVEVGSVSVPVLTMVAITGAVSVLFVSVAASVVPTFVSRSVAMKLACARTVSSSTLGASVPAG